MASVITGLIAMVVFVVFLSHYALTLNSVPLWIIFVAVAAMALADYVQCARGVARKGDEHDCLGTDTSHE